MLFAEPSKTSLFSLVLSLLGWQLRMGMLEAFESCRGANPECPALGASYRVDYSVINPANKWRMLKQQWRLALWCTRPPAL